jgi:hypothetical protein
MRDGDGRETLATRAAAREADAALRRRTLLPTPASNDDDDASSETGSAVSLRAPLKSARGSRLRSPGAASSPSASLQRWRKGGREEGRHT